MLEPGKITLDVIPTGCAIQRATVRVTDRCGPACTKVTALSNRVAMASTSNVTSDEALELSVRAAEPFGAVSVGSLDATLCAIEIELAPMTDALRPPDTGAPF